MHNEIEREVKKVDRIDELKIKIFDNSRKMTDIQKEQKSLYEELMKLEKEREAKK